MCLWLVDSYLEIRIREVVAWSVVMTNSRGRMLPILSWLVFNLLETHIYYIMISQQCIWCFLHYTYNIRPRINLHCQNNNTTFPPSRFVSLLPSKLEELWVILLYTFKSNPCWCFRNRREQKYCKWFLFSKTTNYFCKLITCSLQLMRRYVIGVTCVTENIPSINPNKISKTQHQQNTPKNLHTSRKNTFLLKPVRFIFLVPLDL